MIPDVRLIAVLDPRILGTRDLGDAARAAEAGGATALQVRFKDTPALDLLRATERVLARVDLPVYVNDRADVAWAAGAHGVHLGAADAPAELVRGLAPPPFRIGLSVGSPAEAALARPAAADYWSLGPAFRTASKGDAGEPLGPGGFTHLATHAPPGMLRVAIGGITAANAGLIFEAGASGVAVISAIFGAPDVERATRALRDVVDAHVRLR